VVRQRAPIKKVSPCALTGSSIGPTTAGRAFAILHNRVRRCGPLTADVESLLSSAATGRSWPTAAAAKDASSVQIHGAERNGPRQSVKGFQRLSLPK